MTEDYLVEQALSAVNNLYSDSSVPPETTLDRLEQVQTEIELLIEAILSDLELRQRE